MLGIVLATRRDFARVARLAHAARAQDIDVAMFAMDEGVAALAADRAAVTALLEDEVQVVACGESSHLRGLKEADLGCVIGSQFDHAQIAHKADRLLAFT
jgi:sulfur relay (sulfurtransferase) complex TusBCD TusD component (DsrE family)